jgi:hypothetical protein
MTIPTTSLSGKDKTMETVKRSEAKLLWRERNE